ncbi:hypothetical protein ACWAG0_004727 [Enterobacter hormaechei]
MSTITKEQAKDLRNAFDCWQQDYDPVEDKEQYDMFGLGMVAMDALLASLEAEPVADVVAWSSQNEERTYDVRLRRHDINPGPLYTAPPAPVVQPVMFIDGDISTEDADKLAKVIREFNEEDERPLAKMARIIRENPHPTNECDMPKAQPAPVSVPDDYFASLVAAARVRADKAMRKFPQPNYVLNKVAEESGEVIKAVIHFTEGREEWRNVEGEIIDTRFRTSLSRCRVDNLLW